MNPLAASDPAQIGPYTLLGRLGAGGMGAVYLGRSSGGRRVAIKVIHDHLASDPGFRLRFTREVNAARQVGGLFTAQVVDADTEAPTPWMATRFVEGESLADYVAKNGPFTPDQVKVLAAGVAEALASIHAQGLVHRDLKPGNVLLSPDGPQVIDFGIAVDRAATSFTSTGVVLGTFEYISPEQVENREVTAAADVFALGGLLCYAATGAAPFGSAHPAVMIARVTTAEPDLSRVTDPEVASLIGACMAKKPERRPTPAQLVERTSAARGTTQLPFTQSLAAITATGPVVTAPAETADAASGPALGRRAVLGGAAVAAVGLVGGGAWVALSGHGTTRRGPAPTGPTGPTFVDFAGHPGNIFTGALSADGTLAVIAGSNEVGVLHDTRDGRKLRVLAGHTDELYGATFTADGKSVVTCGADRTVVFWDPTTGTPKRTLSYAWQGSPVNAVAASSDGRHLLTATGDGKGTVWDLRTGRLLRSLPGGKGRAQSAAFSPDGKVAATANIKGTAQLFDVATGKLRRSLPAQGGATYVSFSPDGTLIAVAGYNKTVVLCRVIDGKPVGTLKLPGGIPWMLAWTPDGKTLVTGAGDSVVRFWDVATRQESGAALTLDDVVSTVAISHDGSTLLTGTVGGQAALWDLPARTRRAEFAPLLQTLTSIAVSNDGGTVVSGAKDGSLRLWSPEGKALRALTVPDLPKGEPGPADGKAVLASALSPDGKVVVAGTNDGRLLFWDAATGTARPSREGNNNAVTSLRYTPDGTLVVVGGDGYLRAWRPDGTPKFAPQKVGGPMTDLVLTPDAKLAVTGDLFGIVRLHDLADGKVVRTFSGHTQWVTGVEVSPDGKTVASSAKDKTARLWDLGTGRAVRTLDHPDEVSQVRFSPDGTRLGTSAKDKKVRIWDAAGAAVLQTLEHPHAVGSFVYLPSGKSLVSVCTDGTLRHWTL